MKKITTSLIISSLFVPLFSFALQPVYRTSEEYSQAEQRKIRSYIEGERRLEAGESNRINATGTKIMQIEARQAARLSASTTRPRIASSTRENGFCSQIDKILVNIGQGGQTSGEKRTENMAKRDEKREENRSEVDTRREENEVKRKNQLTELTNRAKTDEQKAAVLTFTTAIEKAIADKKVATDAVLLSHRKEVDRAITNRRTATEKALATLKSDIENAKSKAKTDCANGVTGETVRTTLKDSILKAQQTFRSTTQSIQKDTFTEKREAKKIELQAIEATFKKNTEQAKNNLKSALKAKTVTTSTTSQQ